MPWSLGLALLSAGNNIADVKTKIVLGLALVLFSRTASAAVHEVRIGMYDRSAGMTLHKGNELLKKGDYEAAGHYYDAAVHRDPKEWAPYFCRAQVFALQGKWNLALQDFDTVVRLNRGLLLAAIARGAMHEELGHYSAALADYDRVAKIMPPRLPLTLASALAHRAQLRAACPDPSFRNGSQAIADAKAACNASNWEKSNYNSVLAAAYAEAGDFDSAVRFEQRVIETVPHDKWLTTAEEQRHVLTGCQQRLAMYQRHEPLRHTH